MIFATWSSLDENWGTYNSRNQQNYQENSCVKLSVSNVSECHQSRDHLFALFAVWRESHAQWEWIYGFGLADTLWVAECFQAWFSMEPSIPTFSNTAKR